jgi:hypothetical protein
VEVDVPTGAVTRLGQMTLPTLRDGVKVSPIDPTLIYGSIDEYNPTGFTGRNFATFDLALGIQEELLTPPLYSRDVEFDWGFMAVGGGPATEPVVLPPDDPAPSASTGGPYRAVQFQALQLDAGSSTALTGDALVEWDLDGDGVFGGVDDAVGVRPDVVFATPGTKVIRVRITVGGRTVVSDPSEVEVEAAAVVDPPPPAPGADGPIAEPVLPQDVSATIPARETTDVTMAPVGTRFAVLDQADSIG